MVGLLMRYLSIGMVSTKNRLLLPLAMYQIAQLPNQGKTASSLFSECLPHESLCLFQGFGNLTQSEQAKTVGTFGKVLHLFGRKSDVLGAVFPKRSQ